MNYKDNSNWIKQKLLFLSIFFIEQSDEEENYLAHGGQWAIGMVANILRAVETPFLIVNPIQSS